MSLIAPLPQPIIFLFCPFLIIPSFRMIAGFQYAASQLSYLHSLTFQLAFWFLVWCFSFTPFFFFFVC